MIIETILVYVFDKYSLNPENTSNLSTSCIFYNIFLISKISIQGWEKSTGCSFFYFGKKQNSFDSDKIIHEIINPSPSMITEVDKFVGFLNTQQKKIEKRKSEAQKV